MHQGSVNESNDIYKKGNQIKKSNKNTIYRNSYNMSFVIYLLFE